MLGAESPAISKAVGWGDIGDVDAMSLSLNENCGGVVCHDEPERMLHHADNNPGVVATYRPQPVSEQFKIGTCNFEKLRQWMLPMPYGRSGGT